MPRCSPACSHSSANNTAQLAEQHLRGVPDLSNLPKLQRPVIARALSKDPLRRYESLPGDDGGAESERPPMRLRSQDPTVIQTRDCPSRLPPASPATRRTGSRSVPRQFLRLLPGPLPSIPTTTITFRSGYCSEMFRMETRTPAAPESPGERGRAGRSCSSESAEQARTFWPGSPAGLRDRADRDDQAFRRPHARARRGCQSIDGQVWRSGSEHPTASAPAAKRRSVRTPFGRTS